MRCRRNSELKSPRQLASIAARSDVVFGDRDPLGYRADMKLNERSLDRFTTAMMTRAQDNLARDGYVATAILGLTANDTVTFVEAPQQEGLRVDSDTGFIIVPGPLRDRAEILTELFAARRIRAATMIGEFWTFPESDVDAPLKFIAGTGIAPSQHPQRVEGIIVATLWPAGGCTCIESRRIVRSPTGPYARPWSNPDLNSFRESDQDGTSAQAALTMFVSWLEECLPHRGGPVNL